MPGTDKEFLIRVRADITKAAADMRRMSKEISSQGKSSQKAAAGNDLLSRSYSRMAAAAGTYLTVSSAIKALHMEDDYNVLQQRIKTATKATGDYNKVSRELYEIAQRSGTALQSNVAVYQRIARSASELKATNKEILAVTETVMQLGVISGATNDELKFGLTQFGQAMSSDVVRAEEMNSILENIPEVAARIAQGLHMTVGELRQAVVNGNLLSKDVFDSLLQQAPKVAQEFEGIELSLGRATTKLDNAFSKFLAEGDKALGVVKGLTGLFDDMAYALDKSKNLSEFQTYMGGSPEQRQQVKQLFDERDLAAKYQDHIDQVAKLEQQLAELDDQINATSLQALQQDPLNPSADADKLIKELDELKKKRTELNKTIEQTVEAYGDSDYAAKASSDGQQQSIKSIDKQIKAVNKSLKEQISLYNKQVSAVQKAQKTIDDMKKSSADVRKAISGKGDQTPDTIDISKQLLDAEKLASKGDNKGAIAGVEKAKEMIKDLATSGKEAGIVLEGLLKRAEKTGTAAAEQIKKTETDKLGDIATLITNLRTQAEELQSLKVGFDADGAKANAASLRAALQADFTANPLILPVKVVKTGSAGTEDTTSIPAKAGGGLLRGPGTGTSDSILMYGSDGEYMIKAAAVRKYGVQALEDINHMRRPRFADGGLISRAPVAMPSAPSIPQASGVPINLHIGGNTYPVTAPPDVAQRLQREVTIEAIKRGDNR